MSETLTVIAERALESIDENFAEERDKLQAIYTLSFALARIANRGASVSETISMLQQAREETDFVSEITTDFTAQKLGRPS